MHRPSIKEGIFSLGQTFPFDRKSRRCAHEKSCSSLSYYIGRYTGLGIQNDPAIFLCWIERGSEILIVWLWIAEFFPGIVPGNNFSLGLGMESQPFGFPLSKKTIILKMNFP